MALQVPGFLTFLAGLLAGMATVAVMMAPILAKGLEAHHRIPPSRRGRRRMILAYDGIAAGALCTAGAVLVIGTPLQPILGLVGIALIAVSTLALVAATGNRRLAPLVGPQDATDGSSETNGPPET